MGQQTSGAQTGSINLGAVHDMRYPRAQLRLVRGCSSIGSPTDPCTLLAASAPFPIISNVTLRLTPQPLQLGVPFYCSYNHTSSVHNSQDNVDVYATGSQTRLAHIAANTGVYRSFTCGVNCIISDHVDTVWCEYRTVTGNELLARTPDVTISLFHSLSVVAVYNTTGRRLPDGTPAPPGGKVTLRIVSSPGRDDDDAILMYSVRKAGSTHTCIRNATCFNRDITGCCYREYIGVGSSGQNIYWSYAARLSAAGTGDLNFTVSSDPAETGIFFRYVLTNTRTAVAESAIYAVSGDPSLASSTGLSGSAVHTAAPGAASSFILLALLAVARYLFN
jgi:hypothetical protein